MALKSYIVIADIKTPYVQGTGVPHRPQEVRFKLIRKGEIIKGELKHANNKPAFVLVNGTLVIPLSAVKELVTKDITSNADGTPKEDKQPMKLPSVNKVKYIDALIVGALVGVGGAYLSEKQGWLGEPDKKNKLYGALIGGAVALYGLYRYKAYLKDKPKDKE
jgi:hypothetical protein